MRGLVARLLQREHELPLCGRRLAPLSLKRLDSRFDAERSQNADDLGANGTIGAQAAKRDATFGAVVHVSTLAVITPRPTAISHIQFAAAVATAQQSSRFRRSRPPIPRLKLPRVPISCRPPYRCDAARGFRFQAAQVEPYGSTVMINSFSFLGKLDVESHLLGATVARSL